MLREVDSLRAEEAAITSYAPIAVPRGPMAVAAATPADRYGQGSRLNSPAFALTVLLHVVLIAAMFMVRNHFVHRQHEKLTVLNLSPDMPPPPQAQPDQPKPQPPVVVAPRPLVQTPIQTPVAIQTTPEPAPPQPVALPTVSAAPSPAPPAPAMAVGVLEKGNIDGNILSARPPSYPLESRRKKEQGTVVLSVTIGIDGRVVGISVRQSSGFSRLDDAALDAVRKWKWKPFLDNGQPVVIKGNLPIPFVLQG